MSLRNTDFAATGKFAKEQDPIHEAMRLGRLKFLESTKVRMLGNTVK